MSDLYLVGAGQQSLEGRALASPLTAAKGTLVILVLNQYKCIGCSPGKHPTLERWQLIQTTTVAIACTTGVYAFPFSRLSGREGTRGKIGVARIECSNTQRQKHCEERGDDSKRPLAAFHGSTPFRSKKTTSRVAKRNGLRKAAVAVARKLAVNLHRMAGTWHPHQVHSGRNGPPEQRNRSVEVAAPPRKDGKDGKERPGRAGAFERRSKGGVMPFHPLQTFRFYPKAQV